MSSENAFDPRRRRAEKDSVRLSDIGSLVGGSEPLSLERANGLARAALADDGCISRFEARMLLSHLSADSGICLVGGQSVGLWANVLDPDGRHLSRYMPYATSDIDFLGDLSAAKLFAERSGGRLFKPGPDTMNSNSSALVEVDVSGRKVVIDFLHAIIGVPSDEARKAAVVVSVGDVRVAVLHPLHVLRSRIANMLSAATLRRDIISTNQARAAVEIVGLWCDSRLAEGDERAATRMLSELVSYAERDFFGRKTYGELGIDLLATARPFLDDQRLPAIWRGKSLAAGLDRATARRDARLSRLTSNP
jgi:hypothetical protein